MPEIDGKFRTLRDRHSRAIAGLTVALRYHGDCLQVRDKELDADLFSFGIRYFDRNLRALFLSLEQRIEGSTLRPAITLRGTILVLKL